MSHCLKCANWSRPVDLTKIPKSYWRLEMAKYWHEVPLNERIEMSTKPQEERRILAEKLDEFTCPDWCLNEEALNLTLGCQSLIFGKIGKPSDCDYCSQKNDPLLNQVDPLDDDLLGNSKPEAPTILKEPEDYRRFYADKSHCELVNKIIGLSGTCEWWYEQDELLQKSLGNHQNSLKGRDKKITNLHKVITKQQLKIKRQAENITTLLHLYTSGKRSKSHKKLREKYRALRAKNKELKEALYKSEIYEVLKECFVSPEAENGRD